ncbi:oligosaccharide flippase family protein [bacterium]|nr:oligosaccharide flippase family protein [bacterium]
MKWTGASAVITTLLQLVQRLILANLLVPADFGLVGMVLPVIAFAQAFSDMGISQAIIQRESNSLNSFPASTGLTLLPVCRHLRSFYSLRRWQLTFTMNLGCKSCSHGWR